MIMPFVTIPASLMNAEKLPHEMSDPRGQVRPCPLSVGHPSEPKPRQHHRHPQESPCEHRRHTFTVNHPPHKSDRQNKRHTSSHQAHEDNTPATGTSAQTDQADRQPKKPPGRAEYQPSRKESGTTIDQYVRHDDDLCSRANFKNTSSRSSFPNRSMISCAVPSATIRPP